MPRHFAAKDVFPVVLVLVFSYSNAPSLPSLEKSSVGNAEERVCRSGKGPRFLAPLFDYENDDEHEYGKTQKPRTRTRTRLPRPCRCPRRARLETRESAFAGPWGWPRFPAPLFDYDNEHEHEHEKTGNSIPKRRR